jgi:hypothetical protein
MNAQTRNILIQREREMVSARREAIRQKAAQVRRDRERAALREAQACVGCEPARGPFNGIRGLRP